MENKSTKPYSVKLHFSCTLELRLVSGRSVLFSCFEKCDLIFKKSGKYLFVQNIFAHDESYF